MDTTTTGFPEAPKRPIYRLLTSLLSGFCPGSGQWMLGAKRKAILMFGCFAIIVSITLAVRAPQSYWGFITLVWGLALLCTWSAWSALRIASSRALPSSRWWIAMALVFAMAGFTIHANWILRAAGFRNFDLPSTSMTPTMMRRDKFIVDLRAYRQTPPRDGEIAIYKRNGFYFVKRVIAEGGDVISSKDGAVTLNGRLLQEPYVVHQNASYLPEWMNNFGPVSVPAGKLFVMGDNRDLSLDSRSEEIGFIDLKEVAGKPLYNYRPLDNRAGKEIR